MKQNEQLTIVMQKSPNVRFIINMEQARYEIIIVDITPDPVGDNGFQFSNG